MAATLYTRVVASFAASAPPAAVDALIVLARALGAELQAVLLEDIGTLALAELPSPRAYDPRTADWRDVRRAELLREFELAASMLRRRLESEQGAGMRAQLAVARGGIAAALDQYAQAGDLLVVSEPADPMARWVQPFAGLVDAAVTTGAAVLYLPHRGTRSRGPVAVVGTGVAGELARRVAQALGAPLLEVEVAPSLRAALPQLRAQHVRLVVCERAALGADARAALRDAGDLRIAVLLAPTREAA